MAGFYQKEISLETPTILRELVNFPNVPDEMIIVLINEKGGKMDSLISNRDEVKILPMVGGG